MFHVQIGFKRKMFKTLDEAQAFASEYFRKKGVVLGIEKSKRLTHVRDIRLFNNGGIAYPLCKITQGPLDMDLSRMKTTGDVNYADCPRCHARYVKWYPWATRPKRK